MSALFSRKVVAPDGGSTGGGRGDAGASRKEEVGGLQVALQDGGVQRGAPIDATLVNRGAVVQKHLHDLLIAEVRSEVQRSEAK